MFIIQREQIISAGEDTEKRECLYSLGGKVNWCHHYGKQFRDSSKNIKIKIELLIPFDPAIPLLGI